MSDSEESESSEENLDDFMLKASEVLFQKDHKDKVTILESLKHHLASIFHDQIEMEHFFKTLNGIIFSSSNKKKVSKKISNKKPFKLYSIIFSFNPKSSFFYVDYFLTTLQHCASEENRLEFPYLGSIFADVIKSFFSDNKKNLIKKNTLLEQNKKPKLYEKLLNFCVNNIKASEKTEQSFGCLLLTEFLEKCPLAKEEKNIENIFNIISEYLEDRWFESKLDLLNCTISLIFSAEKKFKPYANTCLCKIIEFLTDEEWMKRKLAVNIVYTLLFYCKEEVLEDKENVLDFLETLRDDPNHEVKEACLQTLGLFEESDPNKEEDEEFKNIEDEDEIEKAENEKKNKNTNKVVQKKKNVKNGNITTKIEREKKMLEKLEKEYNEKRNKYNKSKRINKGIEDNKVTETNLEENENNEAKNKQNNKELNDKINSALYDILQQLKKIKEEQNELFNMYDDVKQLIDKNYTSLNERIKNIEKKRKTYSYNINNSSSSKKQKKNS